MHIKTNDYEIDYDSVEATIVFRGSLLLCGVEDYVPITELLNRALHEHPEGISIDIQNLEFLNSSGITTFTNFAVRGRKEFNFELTLIGQKQVAWQPRLAMNLQRVVPKCIVKLH